MSKPFDPADFVARYGHRCHHGALGVQYDDHGSDWVQLRLDRAASDAASSFTFGPIATLFDFSGLLAVWTALGSFRNVVTLDMRLDYLDSIPSGPIVGRSDLVGDAENDVIFVSSSARPFDGRAPIATATSTFIVAAR
jgi:acyl-coenzyme A thioesterase PaaI-like protein